MAGIGATLPFALVSTEGRFPPEAVEKRVM
jgi:hypothetical protein